MEECGDGSGPPHARRARPRFIVHYLTHRAPPIPGIGRSILGKKSHRSSPARRPGPRAKGLSLSAAPTLRYVRPLPSGRKKTTPGEGKLNFAPRGTDSDWRWMTFVRRWMQNGGRWTAFVTRWMSSRPRRAESGPRRTTSGHTTDRAPPSLGQITRDGWTMSEPGHPCGRSRSAHAATLTSRTSPEKYTGPDRRSGRPAACRRERRRPAAGDRSHPSCAH